MDTTTTTTTNAGQRLLKTGSGDLIFHEWTATLFSHETFTDPTIQRYRLQYPIAIILVALARPTNRTMILPRHVRSQDGRGSNHCRLGEHGQYRAMGALSSWRFMTASEARVLGYTKNNANINTTTTTTKIVEMPSGPIDKQTLNILATACEEPLFWNI